MQSLAWAQAHARLPPTTPPRPEPGPNKGPEAARAARGGLPAAQTTRGGWEGKGGAGLRSSPARRESEARPNATSDSSHPTPRVLCACASCVRGLADDHQTRVGILTCLNRFRGVCLIEPLDLSIRSLCSRLVRALVGLLPSPLSPLIINNKSSRRWMTRHERTTTPTTTTHDAHVPTPHARQIFVPTPVLLQGYCIVVNRSTRSHRHADLPSFFNRPRPPAHSNPRPHHQSTPMHPSHTVDR